MDLTWYNTLNKPFFNPPSWLFAPAWTLLYTLMVVSALLIYRHGFKKKRIKESLKIFVIQLILNLLWSPIFFGAHNILLALLVIIIMWIFILKTIRSFEKIDKIAAYILYPYLAWVSFASLLNISVWLLNK